MRTSPQIARWAAALAATALATLALVALSSSGAGASPRTSPSVIRSALLSQGGQELYWQTKLAFPFSPKALAASNHHLCLLLSRHSDGPSYAELCLADPRGLARTAGLYLSEGTPASRHKISGSLGPTGSNSLSASFLPSAVGLGYREHAYWQVQYTTTSPGCLTSVSAPCTGATVYPSYLKRLRMHEPKLIGCLRKGPDYVTNGSTKVHDIALTFDDGPWPNPPSIDFVNLLHKLHVPATFFEIGDQISEYDPTGAVERLMLADGDMIGDHTWTHPVMTTLSTSAQRSELGLALNKIQQETGFRTCIFRAPYGSTDTALESLALSMGMTTIQWNDDSRDWSLPGTQAIYDTVISEAHNGGIVIQHFGGGPRYETLAAIPEEVATLRSEGYKFVTVTQMLGYKLIYR